VRDTGVAAFIPSALLSLAFEMLTNAFKQKDDLLASR
jgi:hypothetical protein